MSSLFLRVYRLTDSSAALSAALKHASQLHCALPVDSSSLSAEFWYSDLKSETPTWLRTIAPVFNDVPLYRTNSRHGILLIAVSGHQYAVPFGSAGYTLLSGDRIVRGWGRKIALNLIYEEKTGALRDDGHLLRKGRVSKLGRGLVEDVQSSDDVDFDVLGFDRVNEILRSVTVRCADRADWGTYVEGADAIGLRWSGSIDDIERLCGELEGLSSLQYYKSHFDFIDNLLLVRNRSETEAVWQAVAAQIRDAAASGLGITTPGDVDLCSLKFSVLGVSNSRPPKGGFPLDDLTIASYVKLLDSQGVRSTLDRVELLKHRLRYFDDSGQTPHEADLVEWLEGSIDVGGQTYAISQGEVYAVERNYVSAVDTYVDSIDPSLKLPSFSSVPKRAVNRNGNSVAILDERAYNTALGKLSDYLCMDGNNVITVPRRTSAIELCDVLSTSNHLLHVKRGLGSGEVSYVCAQATVSAELLVQSHDFRKQARVKIKSASGAARWTKFRLVIPLNLANGSRYTVAIGLIDKGWYDLKGNRLQASKVLPFFAKIALRQAATRIRELAMTVKLACIAE